MLLPQPIDKDFNELVLRMTHILMPQGFEVTQDAPSTFEDVKLHYNKTGQIRVWNGGSELTIFGTPAVNWAFRAWHDWVHVMHNLGFTPEDEHRVCLIQQQQVFDLLGCTPQATRFAQYLEAEIDGQLLYHEKHGEFPKDQRAFFMEYMEKFTKRINVRKV